MTSIQAPNALIFGAALSGELDPSPLPRFFNSVGLEEASFLRLGVGDYLIRLSEPGNPIGVLCWGNSDIGNEIYSVALVPDGADPNLTLVQILVTDDTGAAVDPALFLIGGFAFMTGESNTIADFIP